MKYKNITALVVDDEQLICLACVIMLGSLGISADTARNPHEALVKMDEKKYDLVLSDYRMPDMTGREFLEQVRAEYPDTIRGLFSATSIYAGDVAHFFIRKPFGTGDLEHAIHKAFETYSKKK